ncbi:class I SAM-dependent methyltransferase [Chondromyces crocatus]|uniref:50S ribosomal protein L11 methyltransferase n=1 Tax=Chondromyces crocatus TaxID=52 RepID=A0A0K1EEG5_CHOCO|nr:50S ribosomal protein L11 methyltransferase [Chondromyces crocatus]AKT39265.1 50S ribosomal protein L11 methyltransferase [Chondromyces crocatus]
MTIEVPSSEARAAAFIVRQTEIVAPPLVPELRLHLATEVTPLWYATERELQQLGLGMLSSGTEGEPLSSGTIPPPYWAFAWAGGQALARHVLDHPQLVAGRRVLDFAAGSGLVALAAAKAGAAFVTAADIDPFAGVAIAMNAALNGETIATQLDDLTTSEADVGWEVILAGDVCYDREMAARVIPWLRACARRGVTVLFGDPGRSYCPDAGVVELGRHAVPTSLDLEGREALETRILQLR